MKFTVREPTTPFYRQFVHDQNTLPEHEFMLKYDICIPPSLIKEEMTRSVAKILEGIKKELEG